MRKTCFYHAGCPDGFGAAYAVWRAWGDTGRYVGRGHDELGCTDVDDGGVSVSQFDKESNDAQIVSERIWTVKMEAKDNEVAKVFTFPSATIPTAEIAFQRYDDADLVEINEAFAAQVLACLRCSASEDFARTYLKRETPVGEIPMDKLNVNGGSIALGHPVGATGARLVLTSLLELRRRDAKRAVVSACVGGGQGMALWLERF